ncbi:hypothetical protein OSTOST_17752, partial [Ostertagia ostertagi]
SHAKLLSLFDKYLFHEQITKWLKELLTGRTFQVRINSVLSDTFPVRSGIPQGGVLSPTLFNIYTADLIPRLEEIGVTCKQYADDLKIYKEIDTPHDIEWQIPISTERLYHMRLGNSSLPHAYHIGEAEIATVRSIKDLGFLYDDKLDFLAHYKEIHRKAFIRTFHIFKALTTCDTKILLI